MPIIVTKPELNFDQLKDLRESIESLCESKGYRKVSLVIHVAETRGYPDITLGIRVLQEPKD